MPYPTASQHLCINAWTDRMHVHGISSYQNPNLACEEQTTKKNKQSMKAETYQYRKLGQTETC